MVDETGFLKQGNKSVGVQRQYSGTAGKVENCQIGVFLAYGSRRGRTFLDRELYLPQVWAEDGERRWEAGIPEAVSFHTKGQLARVMIARSRAGEVPFGWVAGDTVYGNDGRLRQWLAEQKIPYVLAVKNNEPLWADTKDGAVPEAAWRLAQGIPADQWERLSAGEGSKGPRLYDWGRVSRGLWPEAEQRHWLLVRRSITDPMIWPTTPVSVRWRRPWRNRCGWPARGGSSKTLSRRPSRRWVWTSTRCAAGPGGTGISLWPC